MTNSIQKLIPPLQAMLGTAYEITYNSKYNLITIMTPFLDNFGDSIVIYVEQNAHDKQQFRYSEKGWIMDSVMPEPKSDIIKQIQKITHYYAIQLDMTPAKKPNIEFDWYQVDSRWYDEQELIDASYFYGYIQALTDICNIKSN